MESGLVIALALFVLVCANLSYGLSKDQELEQLFQPDPSARQRRDVFDGAINRYLAQAEDELKNKLKKEANLSKRAKSIREKMKGKNRPFQTVQKFLRTSKKARKIAMTQNVLESFLRLLSKQSEDQMTPDSLLESLKNRTLSMYYGADGGDGDGSRCPYKMDTPCSSINTVNTYRTIDGSCNNLQNPLFGKAFSPFARAIKPNYDDGIGAPRTKGTRGTALPSPRRVATLVHTNSQVPDDVSTFMVMTWGQYLDHDIDLTALSKFQDPESDQTSDIICGEDGCESSVDECFPIPVNPTKDPAFKDQTCLEFIRSQGVPSRRCNLGPRQQLNQITSYLDASTVYGSVKSLAADLREKITHKGKTTLGANLRTQPHPFDKSRKPLLPAQDGGSCVDTDNVVRCFLAGDVRANEQSSLTVMHTLWVREHNRIVANLRHVNPKWSEEILFQETRRIVGAIHQHITYNEYLPLVVGENNLDTFGLRLLKQGYFKNYDEQMDATTTNVFATASFRFGHSMISTLVKRADHNFNTSSIRTLQMCETFFRPRHLYNTNEGGTDAFIRGLAAQQTPDVSRFFSRQVSWRLFTNKPPHGLGTDLASLNVQRGRDHGLPAYNEWRKWCGLTPVRDFDDLGKVLKNPWLANVYKSLYSHVDDLDVYTVALSEPQVGGGMLGETFLCSIGREFMKFRRADRFWYEGQVPGTNHFSEGQLTELRKVTLAKVMCNNGDHIDRLQKYVMRLPSDKNPIVDCSSIPDIDFTLWKTDKVPGAKGRAKGANKKGNLRRS